MKHKSTSELTIKPKRQKTVDENSDVAWLAVILALPALDLITFSQVCKTFRTLVVSNTWTWCSNLDIHPNLPVPYHSEYRRLTCLYQLYELYRRKLIDSYTYCQQKSKFFTDEQLFEQCSYMFVTPENRKPTVIDFNPDCQSDEEDIEQIDIETIYGLNVCFWVEDFLENPAGPDKFKIVWNGDLTETETVVQSNAFNFTLQTSSEKLIAELIFKWTGWPDCEIEWLLGRGCSVSCVKQMLEATLNCEKNEFQLYQNKHEITISLGSTNCTEDLAEFWVFYATQVEKLDVENLVILFNDAIINGQLKKFTNLKKTLAQMPGFVEYASRFFSNTQKIFGVS